MAVLRLSVPGTKNRRTISGIERKVGRVRLHSHVEEQGKLERGIGKTFFRRLMPIGERKRTPLFILHGGPGSTHENFAEVLSLAQDRDVVVYDQIGCGRSTRIPKKHWQLKTFVDELDDLRKMLGYGKIDILGHSWGTMLGAEYYFTHPKNVRAMIYSSPCLDAKAWSEDAKMLLKQLDRKHQTAVTKALKSKKYDSKAFVAANEAYYDHFVRRFVPKGDKRPYSSKLASVGFNLEGYMTMWGPVEFIATGSLKSFDRAKDLPHTHVPTLFMCGRYDEATPETVKAQADLTPASKFHVFEKSSHQATLEQPEEFVKVARNFLKSVDGT
jgi:proline iminopeptidase